MESSSYKFGLQNLMQKLNMAFCNANDNFLNNVCFPTSQISNCLNGCTRGLISFLNCFNSVVYGWISLGQLLKHLTLLYFKSSFHHFRAANTKVTCTMKQMHLSPYENFLSFHLLQSIHSCFVRSMNGQHLLNSKINHHLAPSIKYLFFNQK